MPEGSWKCEKCNNINYPFRTKCNRQNCGADKPAESNKSPSPTPDEDNQVCSVTFSLYLHLLLEIVNKNFCTHNKCDEYSISPFFFGSLARVTSYPLPSPPTPTLKKETLFSWIFFYCNFIFFYISSLHPLICNCLLFQWVLGHVWGLRRSRVVVQPCSMWVSESQSCRPHVAAVVELLYLPSNDLCQVVVLTAMVFEVSILFWCIMCQPALSGEDLQVGSGFCS